jgi:hypothetical protein
MKYKFLDNFPKHHLASFIITNVSKLVILKRQCHKLVSNTRTKKILLVLIWDPSMPRIY